MDEVTHADEGSRWKAVRRFASEHPIAVALTLLCAVWAVSAQPLSELAPSVQSLHQWTMVIGTLSWGWWLLMHCVPGVADQGRSLGSIVEHAYVRLALLGFVLLAERSCGNELALVVQVLRNSPDLVYIVGLSAAIVYAAFSFAPKMPGGMLAEARAVMTAQAPRRARERKDIHRTSVHEAGHVLMFALKKTLPDSLRVEVFSCLGRDD
jgi:hypothetical protein